MKPVFVEGRQQPWKIDLPASLSSEGKRTRYFFKTKMEAVSFAEEQKIQKENYGVKGLSGLSPSDLEQAGIAFTLLKPFGVSLTTVVRNWIEREQAKSKSESFEKAFGLYQEHVEKKIVRGRPVSTSYKKEIRQAFHRFPSLHPLSLSELSPAAIAAALETFTPSVKRSLLIVLSAFFSWCMQIPREWIKENPVSKVPREAVHKGKIELYSPSEAKRLLETAQTDLKPYFALGFFAGVRPEELERVKWSHINLQEKFILLPAEVTKTGERRVIKMEPTLIAWLESYILTKGIPKQDGLVVHPSNLRRRLRKTREDAGVKAIQDGARHSYASYWLSIHRDEHELRSNLGHTSADILWKHYNKAVTEKEAREFWDIMPPKSEKVLKFKVGVK